MEGKEKKLIRSTKNATYIVFGIWKWKVYKYINGSKLQLKIILSYRIYIGRVNKLESANDIFFCAFSGSVNG